MGFGVWLKVINGCYMYGKYGPVVDNCVCRVGYVRTKNFLTYMARQIWAQRLAAMAVICNKNAQRTKWQRNYLISRVVEERKLEIPRREYLEDVEKDIRILNIKIGKGQRKIGKAIPLKEPKVLRGLSRAKY